MEKRLSSKQLLRNLLQVARDPFSSEEKIFDIKKILATSSSFSGVNHLVLVRTYFDNDLFPFVVTKEEAYEQAKLAIKERNNNGYYFLYKLNVEDKKYDEARYALNAAAAYQIQDALLEIAKLKKIGHIYEKDIDGAIEYYKIACKLNNKDAYYYLQLLYTEIGDNTKANKVYEEAKSKGIQLLGIIS